MTPHIAETNADDHSLFPSLTDEQLAVRAQEGSSACFGILVERYEARLVTFLTKRLGNTHAAQDIAQDAFVKAWQSRHRYNPKWRYSTWLYTIASRRAANHLRSSALRSAQQLQQLNLSSETPLADSAIAQHEQHSLVWQLANQHLSPAQNTILWLRYGQDLSCKDIARILNSSSVAVRASLHRARKSLREHLDNAQASIERTHLPSPIDAHAIRIHQHRTLHLERA